MTLQNFSEDQFKDKLRHILANHPENSHEEELSWLDGLSITFRGAKLLVTFSHKYFAQWFMANKREIFESAIGPQFFNPAFTAVYSHEGSHTHLVRSAKSTPGKNSCELLFPENIFGRFFFNGKNSLAVAAIRAVVGGDEPVKAVVANSFRILVICGKSGTGKTHLLNAAYDAMRQRYGEERIIKCQAAIFCPEHMQKTGSRFTEIFWNLHNALLLDDLQELAQEKKWQDILANYIDGANAAAKKNPGNQKRLIVTSSGSSTELAALQDRLRSRLECELVVELKEPDMDVRLRFLEHANKEQHLGLTREHIIFLARNAQQIPSIIGLIRKIEFFCQMNGRNPAMDELEAITRSDSHIRQTGWQEILARVAKKLNLKSEDVLGSGRKPEYVLARQLAMYLCRNRLGLSYPELGRLFGGKDHSTVMHGIKKIQRLLETDKVMRKLVAELEIDAT